MTQQSVGIGSILFLDFIRSDAAIAEKDPALAL
jgi:hypothetical protein